MYGRILLVAMVLLGGLVAQTSQAAAGRTSGTFAVTDIGAASYTIPLWLPPGPAGMQPSLTLNYNSDSANGILGVGWSLGGLSSIDRCPTTVGQDGVAGAVELSTYDRFCFNGNRLRLTSTGLAYGAAGTTYRTEIETYQNFTAYSSAGSGPAYFVLKDGDGISYYFGETEDARAVPDGSLVPVSWKLNRIVDPSNNSISISYVRSSGFALPSKVSWAATSLGATTYLHTAQFNYSTTRPFKDGTTGYVAGLAVETRHRLENIQIQSVVSGAAQTVRRYALTYDTSPTTQRSRLTQIKECSDDTESICLSPTTITYQTGQAGVYSAATSGPSNITSLTKQAYDFNGDQRDDLLFVTAGYWHVAFAVPGGFSSPLSTGIPSSWFLTAERFTHSGFDTFLAGPSGGTYTHYRWEGTAFSAVATGAPALGTAADTNGDGLADLMWKETNNQVLIRLNASALTATAPSFSASTSVAITLYPWVGQTSAGSISLQSYNGRGVRRADFNGDGRQDVFHAFPAIGSPAKRLLYSRDTILQAGAQPMFTSLDAIPITMNDDACTDFIADNIIQVMPCANAVGASITVPATPVLVLDWDGDGRTDFAVNNGGYFGIYKSTGSGVSALEGTNIPYSSGYTYFAIDQDGDSLEDIVRAGTSAPFGIDFFTHTSSGSTPTFQTNVPDLAASFVDGFGVSHALGYVSTARSSYTAGTGSSTLANMLAPKIVVAQVTSTDGAAGSFNRTYSYRGGRHDESRNQFTGFEQRVELDTRTNLRRRTTFKQEFPYTGRIYQEELLKANDAQIRHVTNNYSVHATATGAEARSYPFVDDSVATLKDLTSELLISTTTTDDTVDAVTGLVSDRVTTVVEAPSANGAQPGVTHRTEVHHTLLFNHTGFSCFGHYARTALTRSHTAASGTGSAVTRTKSIAAWDYGKCRPTHVQSEPYDDDWELTTRLGYDSFGNVNLNYEEKYYAELPIRQTSMQWDPTGRFLERVTNPEGEVTYIGWDTARGIRTSVTDANGLTTIWTLDEFGRVKREDRPDGTAVDFVYEACTTATCQSGDATIRTQLTTILRNTSNAEVSRSISWLNMFDQEVRSQSLVHSTTSTPKASIVRRTYNSRGLPYEVSAPYISGAATTYNTTFTYDALDRPLFARRRTNEADAATHETAWTYNGLTTMIATPLNHQVVQKRSVVGEILEVIDASGTTTYAHDAFSNLARVQGPTGGPLVMNYNKLGLKTGMDDPNLGLTTYTYHPWGELKSTIDANGNTTHYTYDRLSRPVTQYSTSSGGNQTFAMEWEWGRGLEAQKNVGQMIRAQRAGITESYTYDEFSRLSRRRIVSDATYDYDYGYNALGKLDTLTYPVSTSGYRLALQYQYEIGLLRQIVHANTPSMVFWRSNEMTARGSTKQQVLGNGVVTNLGIDAITGRVGSIQSGVGGGATLQNESYLYDARGNLSQRQNYRLGLTEDFHHDGLDRLETAEVTGGGGSSVLLSMGYNPNGNISSRSDVDGGSAWSYHNTKPNAITQAGLNTYSYDAEGNVISRNGQEIKWTSDNLPWEINAPGKKLTFSYGPSGARYRQVYNNGAVTETTEYIGGLLEKVTVGSAIDWRHYIEANGRLVAVLSRKSTGVNATRFVLTDSLTSVSEILSSTGGAYVSESFAPDGSRRDATDWDGDCNCTDLGKIKDVTRRGYTGHEMIGGVSMDLIHMNGRVYDSRIGRFLSPDPIVQAPYVSQNLNRYSYVLNNPVSYIDPTGFVCSIIQNISDASDPTHQVGGCTGHDFEHYYHDYGGGDYAYDTRGGGGGSGVGNSGVDLSAGVSPNIGNPMAPIMMAFQVRSYKVMEPSEAQKWANKCVNANLRDSGFGQASVTDRAANGTDLADRAVKAAYGAGSDGAAVSGYYSKTFGKIDFGTDVLEAGKDLVNGDRLRFTAGAIDAALDLTGRTPPSFAAGVALDEFGGAKGMVDSSRKTIEPILGLGTMGVAQVFTRSMRGEVASVGCTP